MGTRNVPRMYRGTIPTVPPTEPTQTVEPIDWPATAASVRGQVNAGFDAMPRPRWSSPTLEDILVPERNSFGVMRVCLATAVLISHAFFLHYGLMSAEPLYGVMGYTLGQHAVQIFFFLSGVLVAQSLARSRSIKDYAIARSLRIFPALIVCVLLTALVLGPWLTTLGSQAYLKSPDVAVYILKTISLMTGSEDLPGLFANNTVPHVVNTSLWTLKYEVLCYVLLAGIGAVAFYSGFTAIVVTATASVWFAYMLVRRPELSTLSRLPEVLSYFALFFGSGVVAYLLRDVIRLNGWIALALGGVAWASRGTNFAEIGMVLALGYGVLWVSTFRFGEWRAFANTSDYSYGIYIYSMPVTQALILLQPNMPLVTLIPAALGVTLILAFLSWELVERPALNLRHAFKSAKVATADTVAPRAAATVAATSIGDAVMSRFNGTATDATTEATTEATTDATQGVAAARSTSAAIVDGDAEGWTGGSIAPARLKRAVRPATTPVAAEGDAAMPARSTVTAGGEQLPPAVPRGRLHFAARMSASTPAQAGQGLTSAETRALRERLRARAEAKLKAEQG